MWKEAEEKYEQDNREWLPCSEEFYDDMLGCMPPLYAGSFWGVCEAWGNNERGQPLYLFFRSKPQYACRIATVAEIKQESSQQCAGKSEAAR